MVKSICTSYALTPVHLIAAIRKHQVLNKQLYNLSQSSILHIRRYKGVTFYSRAFKPWKVKAKYQILGFPCHTTFRAKEAGNSQSIPPLENFRTRRPTGEMRKLARIPLQTHTSFKPAYKTRDGAVKL